MKKKVRFSQLNSDGEHPVETVIKLHQPDIIVVNEVINAFWGSDSVKILKDSGYDYISIGPSPTPRNSLTRLNLVASKSAGEVEKIPIENKTGGRFCGLRISKYNLLVIGVLASPFYSTPRKKQIKLALEYGQETLDNNGNVILAGDLNCELCDLEDVNLPNGFSCFTDKSFPHPKLFDELNNTFYPLQLLFKKILSLTNRQRALDHIFYPKSAELIESKTIETTSDHLGIIATIELNK